MIYGYLPICNVYATGIKPNVSSLAQGRDNEDFFSLSFSRYSWRPPTPLCSPVKVRIRHLEQSIGIVLPELPWSQDAARPWCQGKTRRESLRTVWGGQTVVLAMISYSVLT